MTIIAFNHRWVIRWPWLLVNLLVVSLLVMLSVWQWQRALYKTEILERLEHWQSQGALDTVALTAIPLEQIDGVGLQFPVRWLSPVVWLLDNRIYQGRVGYDVVVPVVADGLQQPVVVNLGWVPAPAMRTQIPYINIPAEFELNGVLRARNNSLLLGQNIEQTGTWPLRIQQLALDQLFASLPEASNRNYSMFYPGVVYQQESSPFVVHYRPVVMPPEKHRAYALQWALLALAVVVISLVASARKCEQTSGPDN
jgi:cytochrome oxidase assembly protein ShyY1